MADRTPTTEEVLDYWVNSQYPDTYGGDDVRASRAFKRWLAAHDAEVAREAAAQHWDEGHDAGFYAREKWLPLGEGRDASESTAQNPYRKPEPPVSAQVLAAMPEVPPFPTIRKENSDD